MRVEVDGIVLDIPADSRVVTQLGNLKEVQEEKVFSDARDGFSTLATDAVMDLTNADNVDALSGMSLIVSLDSEADPQIVKTELISVKKSIRKKREE